MTTHIRHIHNSEKSNKNSRKRMQRIWLLHHFRQYVGRIRSVVSVLAVIASAACLVELTLYLGFERTPLEELSIKNIMRISQGVFLTNIILGLILDFKTTVRKAGVLKWIIDIALIVSAIAWLYPCPQHPWLPWIASVVYSDAFMFAVLASYAVLELCLMAMLMIGRRTNPALILSGSFIIFILIGSFLLMLPRCTYTPISYCDSLFVSTSAVCITGLTPVDIPSTFTPGGLLIIAVLMQIGGLGVITFTSFFAMFFSGTQSIYSQLLVKDMIYSKSLNNLIPTLLYILVFTIVVELAGAVAVYLTIPDSLGFTMKAKAIFAGFHSLSSFCNAGFSCLPGGMANPALMNSNQSIYVVTSMLIFAGAIGFPLLVNLKEIFVAWLRRVLHLGIGFHAGKRIHVYDLNTKLVLITTLSVLAVGSVAFFILEYNNSLAGMTLSEKAIQSVFNSLIPRSAGFTSVNPATFMSATLLLIVVQMWIGGASQSLAGGIKVNTFAAVLLNIRAIIRGHGAATAFDRRIAPGSIRRANAVLTLAIGAFIFYSVTLLLLEPQLSPKSLLFEATSALFTVGSSLGATEHLGTISKLLLTTAMFVGRVGILSLLAGFGGGKIDRSSHYPADNIIIS